MHADGVANKLDRACAFFLRRSLISPPYIIKLRPVRNITTVSCHRRPWRPCSPRHLLHVRACTAVRIAAFAHEATVDSLYLVLIELLADVVEGVYPIVFLVLVEDEMCGRHSSPVKGVVIIHTKTQRRVFPSCQPSVSTKTQIII